MQNVNRSIKLLPQKKIFKTPSGQTLFESLIQNGFILRSDCGGKGQCNKCRVDIVEADGNLNSVESCQYPIDEDLSIKIPDSSIASSYVMTKAQVGFPEAFKNQMGDEPAENTYGIAVDLGTTTIAVYLCNISKKEVISSISIKNPQAIYGDDAISRIGYIGHSFENLNKLKTIVAKTVNWAISKLLSSFEDQGVSLSKSIVVGNPTMLHIFVGIDPAPIGVSPYKPVFHDSKVFQSDQIGFIEESIPVRSLPNVSGFIGGDILAAALSIEIQNQPDGTILIDLGTNGELILKTDKKMYATSCATGPAFEGATLSCGMQALPGAITSIKIGNKMEVSELSMINPSNTKIHPLGICGPGIINTVAQLYDHQIIKPDGAFRLDSNKFLIASGDKDKNLNPIYISQKDIRSVQLGKSALYTGIEFLLNKAGLKKPQKIIIAGTFGAHLNKADLTQIGMITEIDHDKILIAGNLAGSGAVMALCDERYMDEAIEIASKIEVIDLACDVNFQKTFIKNLKFPSR